MNIPVYIEKLTNVYITDTYVTSEGNFRLLCDRFKFTINKY